MAQARKTFFSLGGPTYMEDPRVAEAQRQQSLGLDQQRINLQAQQNAQSNALARQQMALEGALARERMGLDLQRALMGREESAAERTLRESLFGREQAGLDRRSQAQLDAQRLSQQAGFDFRSQEAGLQRGFDAEQGALGREQAALLAELRNQSFERQNQAQISATSSNVDKRLAAQAENTARRIAADDRRSEREAKLRRDAWKREDAARKISDQLRGRQIKVSEDRLGYQKDADKAEREAQAQLQRAQDMSVAAGLLQKVRKGGQIEPWEAAAMSPGQVKVLNELRQRFPDQSTSWIDDVREYGKAGWEENPVLAPSALGYGVSRLMEALGLKRAPRQLSGGDVNMPPAR